MTELTDATFYAPLKTTLVPTNGTGNPTFTRATTKNVFDNEGNLKTLKSGAVALSGASVGQNHTVYSEDFSVAGWVHYGSVTSPSANVLKCANATSQQYIFEETVSPSAGPIGSKWLMRFRVQYIDTQYLQITGGFTAFGNTQWCNFDLINGDYTATGCTATMTAVSSGIWDIDVVLTVSNAPFKASTVLCFAPSQSAAWVQSFVGDGIKSVGVIRFQLEDVTYSDIVAGPYVSAGVLSAPFHGAGVDGVKYFNTDSSGAAIPDATMLGAHIDPASKTNNLLHCRDLTNAAWVKTNVTAAKTQIGVDGLVNGCSLLTATAANATCLQTITAASTPACSGFYVKRSAGTGSVYITRDGGSNWTDITSLINSSTFTCVKIENTSVTNPQVGIKIATSGDAIIVDAGLNHAGTQLCEPIFTTTAAVTRNAEVLTYQTASNFSDTAGTVLATFRPTYDTWPSGSIVGKASFGLLASTANSGVQAADGTNTVNGLSGTPSGQLRIGVRWSGSSLQAFYETNYGAVGSYDGSFNLSTIAVNPGAAGYIRDVAIFNSSLADVDMPWYIAPPDPEPETYIPGGGGYVDGLVRYHKLLDAAQRAREDRKSELKAIPVSLKEKKAFKKKITILKLEIEKELKQEDFSFKDVESAVEEKGYKFNNLMYIMSLNILRQKAESRNQEKIAAEMRRIEGIIALQEYENERVEILSIIELIH